MDMYAAEIRGIETKEAATKNIASRLSTCAKAVSKTTDWH